MNDDKAKIDQTVTSHNQMGGITAHTVTIQVQQRSLSPEASTALSEQLRGAQPGSLRIGFTVGVGDGAALMTDFINAFAKGGWRIAAIAQFFDNPPQRGLILETHTDIGVAAADAFARAGIPARQIKAEWGTDAIDLTVTIGMA
jgi:hypothetical protein